MPACRFETLSPRTDRFTPDERTDRPSLGAVHGRDGTLVVDAGASPAHLTAFLEELREHDRPPVVAIALTHWHWDHSFGAAALDVPLLAHEETARELAVQAGYDWSDEALEQRVRAGLELRFCADMIRLELPDRGDLRIVVPSETFPARLEVDLGGVTAAVEHVGGDHAADSCVVHVPADGVLFLGDCLYQRLHAPEPCLTVGGVTALVERIRAFEARLAVEGHADDADDERAHSARLDELARAATLVGELGAAARERAGTDEELRELIDFLLVGEAASRRTADSPVARSVVEPASPDGIPTDGSGRAVPRHLGGSP